MITAEELAAKNPDERVTEFLTSDVTMPGGVGTMALITLDNGYDHNKPNTLGPQGLLKARAAFEQAAKRAADGEIQAIAVTGKPFIFAAGADLSDVSTLSSPAEARAVAELGHDVLGMLGTMSVPTFAFLNGLALGGGLEVGLHCDYRTVSTYNPALALPECFLGLVPGWGGAYLLPRLIGPEKALKIIVGNAMNNNKMMKARDAMKLGVADVMFDGVSYLEKSIAWAASVVSGETVVDRRRHTAVGEPLWSMACDVAAATLKSKLAGPDAVPAPFMAIELVRGACTATREEAFEAENEALEKLICSEQFRSGVYALDLVQRRAKRPQGVPKVKARPVTKVGIIGAGLMASQLAVLFARRLGTPVVMTDLDDARAQRGVGYAHAQFDELAEKGRLTPDAHSRMKRLVTATTSLEELSDAEFVIEAVFEDMEVKKTVFANVAKHVSDTCILATNTSSLSITEMAKDVPHPERVVGFHFFNPVAVMPLLEVIRAEQTDDETYASAFAVGKSLKKTCVPVKDSPSFVVNRLLGRFLAEVGTLVDAGTPIDVVEKAFRGMAPMPPFKLIGLVGPVIALHNAETLNGAFPKRFKVPTILRSVVDAGLDGFYTKEGKKTVLNPDALKLLPDLGKKAKVLDREAVRKIVFEALAQEVRLMLDDEVVGSPQDIDLAMITGAGFQFSAGGLTPLLDREGASTANGGSRFLEPGVASLP